MPVKFSNEDIDANIDAIIAAIERRKGAGRETGKLQSREADRETPLTEAISADEPKPVKAKGKKAKEEAIK